MLYLAQFDFNFPIFFWKFVLPFIMPAGFIILVTSYP